MPDLNHPAPRSAHVFSAVKPAPVEGFSPTHRRIETGALLERITVVGQDMVYTYPHLYPGVIVRDDTGRCFFILEEVWDQHNKKKKLVNYEPLEA
jgi:hypothetical protein